MGGNIEDSGWCILRAQGRHTISLAETLAEDGFEVWTPIEVRTVKVPKATIKRELRQPIMPSYIFARAHHLGELFKLARLPVKPRRGDGLRKPAHANFRVMMMGEKIPVVSDRHLRALRRLEAKSRPRSAKVESGTRYGAPIKRAAYAFPRNAEAKVCDGPFGGMTGHVLRSTDKITVLSFDGRRVEIPTSLLEPSVLHAHIVDTAQDAEQAND